MTKIDPAAVMRQHQPCKVGHPKPLCFGCRHQAEHPCEPYLLAEIAVQAPAESVDWEVIVDLAKGGVEPDDLEAAYRAAVTIAQTAQLTKTQAADVVVIAGAHVSRLAQRP